MGGGTGSGGMRREIGGVEYATERFLDGWFYFFGDTRELRDDVSSRSYIAFSILERVAGYGNLIAKYSFPELRGSYVTADVVTADVLVRDTRWFFLNRVFMLDFSRNPGIVGSVRELTRLLK